MQWFYCLNAGCMRGIYFKDVLLILTLLDGHVILQFSGDPNSIFPSDCGISPFD